MASWMERLENPVLIKELRSRMRGAKPYWIMLGYVGILVVIFWISYGSWRTNTEATASSMGKFGETLFTSLTITQLILCFMLAPALTSGAITIEREQRTFDLLLITLLRPKQIFVGKLLSALSYLALLLVSSLPLMALSFLFGGISPMDLVISFLVILCSGLFFGVVGLGASSMFPRTAAATAVAYGATLLIAGATIFGDTILRAILLAAPVFGPAACTAYHPLISTISPIIALLSVVRPDVVHWHIGAIEVPVYPATLIAYALLGLAWANVATRHIRPLEIQVTT